MQFMNFILNISNDYFYYMIFFLNSTKMELHPFWRQDEFVTFCQSKGIHVSAHTPLGVPRKDATCGEEETSITQRSTSVHAPMLRTSVVSEIAKTLNRTPAQVIILII